MEYKYKDLQGSGVGHIESRGDSNRGPARGNDSRKGRTEEFKGGAVYRGVAVSGEASGPGASPNPKGAEGGRQSLELGRSLLLGKGSCHRRWPCPG